MCFEGGVTIYEGNGNGDGWSEFGCPSEKIGGYLCDLTTWLFSLQYFSAFAVASLWLHNLNFQIWFVDVLGPNWYFLTN